MPHDKSQPEPPACTLVNEWCACKGQKKPVLFSTPCPELPFFLLRAPNCQAMACNHEAQQVISVAPGEPTAHRPTTILPESKHRSMRRKGSCMADSGCWVAGSCTAAQGCGSTMD
eukprot:352556-Chlamydomonas_euryale.AAC.5